MITESSVLHEAVSSYAVSVTIVMKYNYII